MDKVSNETEENIGQEIKQDSTNKHQNQLNCICARKHSPEEMIPVGTLLHVIPIQTTDNPTKVSYILRKVDEVEDFKKIKICSNMVTDHMPPEYIKSLRKVNETWQ